MSERELTGEETLARVARYREAARLLVRSDATVNDVCLGLMDIVDMARGEPDLTVRQWAQIALWQEAAPYLGMADEAPELPPESFEQRHRRLRLVEGLDACPTCLSRLATEDDLRRWARLRRQYAEQLAAREGAVGP